MESQQLKQFVKDKIDDMKARDVIELDVRGKSSITDTMIICSGNSKRHVSSIAENVMVEAKNAGHVPISGNTPFFYTFSAEMYSQIV